MWSPEATDFFKRSTLDKALVAWVEHVDQVSYHICIVQDWQNHNCSVRHTDIKFQCDQNIGKEICKAAYGRHLVSESHSEIANIIDSIMFFWICGSSTVILAHCSIFYLYTVYVSHIRRLNRISF